MDRNFAAVQKTLVSTPALADVRLVTMTLDPAYDTPAVLKPYAVGRGADPKIWSFLTGEPAEMNRFGTQLGIYVEHNPQSAIAHHTQPANGRDRSGRPSREGPQRQFLDAVRTRCRPQRVPRSRALTRSSRRRSR